MSRCARAIRRVHLGVRCQSDQALKRYVSLGAGRSYAATGLHPHLTRTMRSFDRRADGRGCRTVDRYRYAGCRDLAHVRFMMSVI
jgi:hypothetical protein